MNDVSEKFMEATKKEVWEPFMVIETTDAFREPYAIWDSGRKSLLIETDGTVPTFPTRQEAEDYLLKITC